MREYTENELEIIENKFMDLIDNELKDIINKEDLICMLIDSLELRSRE